MSKRRPVPANIQTQLLLANRHACCVCQKPKVQIHHIDGNPSNNSIQNLAALCLDHHEQASMVIGLTKKLQSEAVLRYKNTWESRCAEDIFALSRDRLNYYVTLYKNPQRIRELFVRLPETTRHEAVAQVMSRVSAEAPDKANDHAFGFQWTPQKDNMTRNCLVAAALGETWPSFLHRVPGHPQDPDLPIDLSPPYGMTAFHGFDLYCQILVQTLCAAQPPLPLEDLYPYRVGRIDAEAGRLITFRETATGKGVLSPSTSTDEPLSRVTLRRRFKSRKFETVMQLRNMYVFSDTSAENLRRTRACGVAVLTGAERVDAQRIRISAVPLLIGMGGIGQSSHGGWGWNLS